LKGHWNAAEVELTMGDQTLLTVSLTGKGVVKGTLRADRLVTVLDDLQNTLNRIGMVASVRSSTGRTGAFPKDIKEACALTIIGIRKGSVAIDLRLIPSPSLDHEGLGDRSITALVDGVSSLESGIDQVPKDFDIGVLEKLDSLVSVMDDDIDRISFNLKGRKRAKRASLTRASRARLSTLVNSTNKWMLELSGDLLELDLERNRCQVFLSEGGYVRCSFPGEMASDLSSLFGRRVRLHGLAEGRYGTDTIQGFQIQDILGEEGEADMPPKTLTARTLLDTGLTGMWADRVDVVDPVAYADELRRLAGRRRH
jgi:hypothetical protein